MRSVRSLPPRESRITNTAQFTNIDLLWNGFLWPVLFLSRTVDFHFYALATIKPRKVERRRYCPHPGR